jgi:hypothetical protein
MPVALSAFWNYGHFPQSLYSFFERRVGAEE